MFLLWQPDRERALCSGSLPCFPAAFVNGKTLPDDEAEELMRLICRNPDLKRKLPFRRWMRQFMTVRDRQISFTPRGLGIGQSRTCMSSPSAPTENSVRLSEKVLHTTRKRPPPTRAMARG